MIILNIIFWALVSTVGYFALVPLKAAAEYRFRGKTGLLVEGLAFLACAVLSVFTGGIGGWLLLAGGVAAGVGLRSRPDNNQRYLD